MDNNDFAGIDPLRGNPNRSNKSGNSTPLASSAQSDLNADPLIEWGQRAMALHGNDALRREVAKRSF
jgi:hypothetical protein